MDEAADDRFPALRARRSGSITQEVDRAGRVFWRAFQRGELSEEELARTLQRLEPPPGAAAGRALARAHPADQPATPTSSHSHSCSCSVACQQVHTACRGCGVLEGPDHLHRLREGYCYALLTLAETGAPTLVPAVQSCWSVHERLRQPLAIRWVPARRERELADAGQVSAFK